MMRWLTDLASPRGLEAALRVTSDENSDLMMTDLVTSEIEEEVGKFETQEDLRKSQTSLQNNMPDYSWLAINSSASRRRLLTLTERSKIEASAELLCSEEWNQALANWRGRVRMARSRSAIIEAWSTGVQEIVAARPPPVSSVADQLVSYLRHRTSVSQAQTGLTPRDDDRASVATELTNVSTIMPIDTQRSFSSLTSLSSPPPSGRPSSAHKTSVAPLTSGDICDAV